MNIENAIKFALDKEAILFLGAGFSVGGTNKEGMSLPVGKDLSYLLCDDMGIPRYDNLTTISSRYVDDPKFGKGLPNLIEFLKSKITCIDTNWIQDTIIGLPWKRIYTTNYDNIVEISSKKNNINRSTITSTFNKYTANTTNYGSIIHINGYIINLNEKNFYDEFKITDDGYNRNGFLESGWGSLFESDIKRSKAIVFIGYSMNYDIQLKKLIYLSNIKDKCIFIDRKDIDDNNAYNISIYGTLETCGTEKFALDIDEMSKVYKPREKIIGIEGFRKVSDKDYNNEAEISSIEVLNLLVDGFIKKSLLREPLYLVKREEHLKAIINNLDNFDIFILTSHLGNGKTIFLEYLASQLVMEYNVYFLKDISNLENDLDIILKDNLIMNIILIDDYGIYIRIFNEFRNTFPKNLKIIATCRTSINNNLYYDLTEKYKYDPDRIFTEDLDVLYDSEVNSLVELLDSYRFWGNNDKLSKTKKKEKIKDEYKSQLSRVFYILLDSKIINRKLDDIVKYIFSVNNLKKFLIAQSINNICNLKMSFSDVCKLANIDTVLLRSNCKNLLASEIFDLEHGIVCIKSSVISQYLIKNAKLNGEIMDTLKSIFINAEKYDYDGKFHMLKKNLVSRSNIKLIFSKRSNDSVNEHGIFDYYDKIKNLKHASNNPFFWLQFGITAIHIKEYELAKIYFANAYSNIKKLDQFDTFQLDTHNARLLLESEISTNLNSKDQALKTFYEAHNLLKYNSNSGKNLFYVLRQMELYYNYFVHFKSILSVMEKLEFIRKAAEINEKFEIYFRLESLKEIPFEIIIAYRSYRKLFKNYHLILDTEVVDILFNEKLGRYSNYRV